MSNPIQKRQRFMSDILPRRIAARFSDRPLLVNFRPLQPAGYGVIIPSVKLRWILIFLIGLSLTAAAGLLYLQGTPRVASVDPVAEASNVPAGAALRLTFSHPMDAESVAQRLAIE